MSLPRPSDFDDREIFVDRTNERERFHRALQTHQAVNAAKRNDPDDQAAPRQNLMAFYGVGGYGKTALSKRLQAELAKQPEVATARLNLEPHVGADFETMLLSIRARLSEFGSFPAFDTVFSGYWAERHPGSDFGDFVRRDRLVNKLIGKAHLPEHLSASLQDLANQLGVKTIPSQTGALAATVLSGLYTHVRGSRRKKIALDNCLHLPYVLEKLEQDEEKEPALNLFPYLLAWDLNRKGITLVVFIDAFEELADRSRRELEKSLNAMLWLMPNAFFLVTGRNEVDWGDADVPRKLEYKGPAEWPGLECGADEEPRQLLVERLAEPDAEDLLKGRLTHKTTGEARIPAEIRSVIVRHADGWPEFLELSVDLFRRKLTEKEPPSPADFDNASFEELMERLCQDLSPQEQSVLNAMSMLDGFSLELAAKAANRAEGDARALASRSFLRPGEGRWPYYLSPAVSRCVRDSTRPGAWTPADWRTAAERAVDEMGRLYRDARASRDRSDVIKYLNQSIRLAHEYGLELGWIAEAALAYVEDYVWESELLPSVPAAKTSADIVSAAQALGLALIAIRERQGEDVHRSDTLAALNRCLDAQQLDGDAHDLVSYFRAECLRDTADSEVLANEAEAAFEQLIGEGRPMHLQASEGVIYVQRRNGRFTGAQARINQLPESPLKLRLLGDVFWNNARFADAELQYKRSSRLALDDGLVGQAAEAEASRAFALGFEGGAAAAECVARARELLNGARNRWAELQADNAELLRQAGTVPDFRDRYTAAMAAGAAAGLSSITAYAALAGAFDAAVRDDRKALDEARGTVASLVSERHLLYLLETVDFWRDPQDGRIEASETDWLDGAEATARRWRAVLSDRRSQVTALA